MALTSERCARQQVMVAYEGVGVVPPGKGSVGVTPSWRGGVDRVPVRNEKAEGLRRRTAAVCGDVGMDLHGSRREHGLLLEMQKTGGTRRQTVVAREAGAGPLLEWGLIFGPLLERHRAEVRGDRQRLPMEAPA